MLTSSLFAIFFLLHFVLARPLRTPVARHDGESLQYKPSATIDSDAHHTDSKHLTADEMFWEANTNVVIGTSKRHDISDDKGEKNTVPDGVKKMTAEDLWMEAQTSVVIAAAR
ncbi:hypothetical protein K474DRAFT_1660450 [Panus rudis PR-1116 ss-1]|nr:hypothetical protein K474DRAFT_1660450 [Panus rudis PR-1116 ss-1]